MYRISLSSSRFVFIPPYLASLADEGMSSESQQLGREQISRRLSSTPRSELSRQSIASTRISSRSVLPERINISSLNSVTSPATERDRTDTGLAESSRGSPYELGTGDRDLVPPLLRHLPRLVRHFLTRPVERQAPHNPRRARMAVHAPLSDIRAK